MTAKEPVMIIHLDLDCFFVSAERLRNPAIKGKCVAVGGRSDRLIFSPDQAPSEALDINGGVFVPPLFLKPGEKANFDDYFIDPDGRIRGIVTTASYEARKYGVTTGMSLREALARCPQLIVLPPDHRHYHTLSNRLKTFLQTKIPVVEQYSIDEFFADPSGWITDAEIPAFIENLREEVEARFGLPASIGAAPAKWIAKLATGFAKPEGCQTVHDIRAFVAPIPIGKFPGIGKGMARRLGEYKIATLGELLEAKRLLWGWKQPGRQLWHRVNGSDAEGVVSRRDRRSFSISRTFDPLIERRELRRRLVILCRHLAFLIGKNGVHPLTLHLSVRYQFGQKAKRSVTCHRLFSESYLICSILELFKTIDRYASLAVIRLRLSCSNFLEANRQTLSLCTHAQDAKMHRLWQGSQQVRLKHGLDALRWGSEMAGNF